MPHVIVKMHPGRSEQQKVGLTEAIVKDVMTFTGVGEAAVSVSIEEIGAGEWTDEVYQPIFSTIPASFTRNRLQPPQIAPADVNKVS